MLTQETNAIQLTAIDLAVDVRRLLAETEAAIVMLTTARQTIPSEAGELLSVLKRCVVAEAKVKELFTEMAEQTA